MLARATNQEPDMVPPIYELAMIEHAQRLAAAEQRRSVHMASPRRRWIPRRHLRNIAAAILLPALVAGWSTATGLLPGGSDRLPVPAFPAPPAHDPDKFTAVVVAGATGAESLDVLATYEVLAASGRFNVYTLAPRREVLPLFPASPNLRGVDFVPHYSFDQYARHVGTPPDLVVLPYVPAARDDTNAPMLSWLRKHVTSDTTLLTICGGSWVAADAGLLDGRAATTHRNLTQLLTRDHPDVHWVEGKRWVEDGNVISSAGITAAVDATLRAIETFAGRTAAEHTATRLGYPHLGFLDDPAFALAVAGTSVRTMNAAFRPDRTALGVALYNGVGEIQVASIIDLYPRTLSNTVHPIGTQPGIVTTRHGLQLAPRHDLTGAPKVNRLLVPGTPPDDLRGKIERQAGRTLPPAEYVHAHTETFAFDAVLRDIAEHDSRAAARLVATGIEYPLAADQLTGRTWPVELILRAVALSLVGVLSSVGLARWRQRQEVAA